MDLILAFAGVDHGLETYRVAAPNILSADTVTMESKELFKKRKISQPKASTLTVVNSFKGKDPILAPIPSFE